MENGWGNQLQQQQQQQTKLEEEQCGVALDLAEKLGQSPGASQQTGTKRKRGSTAKERISKMPPATAGKRSSIYRGVTRHRWTGRYEAHLWDKGTWNHTQNKKGKQVYLGAYDDEEAAARAYDLAALKYWGPGTLINFPVTDYSRDIEEMQSVTREEYLASLRRKSSGFSRGVSKYRGVARHHHNGRWEARIGRVFGNKYLYLGTYSTQEEAATAYDMAAIEYRGLNAVTNFDLSRYIRWLRPGQGNNNNDINNKASLDAEADNCNEFVDEILQVDKNDNATNDTTTRVWPAQPSAPYELPSLGLTPTISSKREKKPPTALGLLLQSDMFKQMLEKTSSGSCQLQEDQDMQQFPQQQQQQGASFEGVGVDLNGQPYEHMYSTSPCPLQQHDFGLVLPSHQRELLSDAKNADDEKDNEEEDNSGGVWNAFGGSIATLPLANAISTC